MPIRDEDLGRLETLAALRLEPQEREQLRQQLEGILAYVRQLQELDVDAVPPTTHGLATRTPLRADLVQPSTARAAMLRNAADTRDGFYRVPRFVGDEEES